MGGIEPPCQAWEACVLPLNYTRMVHPHHRSGWEEKSIKSDQSQEDTLSATVSIFLSGPPLWTKMVFLIRPERPNLVP